MYDEPSGRNKGRYKFDFPDGESPSKRGGPPIKGKAERVPQSQGKSKGVKDKNLIQSDSQKEGKEMFEEERFGNVELENALVLTRSFIIFFMFLPIAKNKIH